MIDPSHLMKPMPAAPPIITHREISTEELYKFLELYFADRADMDVCVNTQELARAILSKYRVTPKGE